MITIRTNYRITVDFGRYSRSYMQERIDEDVVPRERDSGNFLSDEREKIIHRSEQLRNEIYRNLYKYLHPLVQSRRAIHSMPVPDINPGQMCLRHDVYLTDVRTQRMVLQRLDSLMGTIKDMAQVVSVTALKLEISY